MDAMVAVKFLTYSKQRTKVDEEVGRSQVAEKEAGRRHTHRRGQRMDTQQPAFG